MKIAGRAHLRIMETTDLHMHVLPYDYYSDRPVDTVGLSRTASVIADIRRGAANSLLFDNGDFLQGNPMGDYIAHARGLKDGDLHPMIDAMNTLGYDAATVGNHDFNYGLPFLMTAMARANFPVVLSNVLRRQGAGPRQDDTLFAPYALLDREIVDGSGQRHSIKIGVIGFTPPQIVNWDHKHLDGKVSTRRITEAAEGWVPQLREAGADVVIALSHSGIGLGGEDTGHENASLSLAAVPGIDALLTGHVHLVFPSPVFEGPAGIDVTAGTLHGKPAVMAGLWGSHLGVIDLLLERDGNSWHVLDSTSRAYPIATRDAAGPPRALVADDPEICRKAQDAHEETLGYIRRGVGKTAVPLHSYFALVADAASVKVVASAQLWYIRQMLAGTEYEALPMLSAAAPFKAGGRGGPDHYTDVPIGDVAIKNVADLYIYPNTVRAVRVTGAQLRFWLERSAGIFNQITPGTQDAELLDPFFPSYNFDVITQVNYCIDLSQPSRFDAEGQLCNPEAQRILNLTYDGKPVSDDMHFIVATNDYRASGGGEFPGANTKTTVFEAPDKIRDVITRFILEKGTISPDAAFNWRFAHLPDTSVIFETSPEASAYLESVKGVQIEAAGDGRKGFARFRLRL